MSDLESLEPKKPVRTRKVSAPVATDLPESGTPKPKRVYRKKVTDVSTAEMPVSEPKPRARRTVVKTAEAVKEPTLSSGATLEPTGEVKRVVRKRTVKVESSDVETQREEKAPERKKKAPASSREEREGDTSFATPPVANDLGTQKRAPRRKNAEERDSVGESAVSQDAEPASRLKHPRTTAVRIPRHQPGDQELRRSPDAENQRSYQENRSENDRPAVRRTSIRRMPDHFVEKQYEKSGDSMPVVERVSGLTENTPVEGLPVRNTRFVRRENNDNRRDNNGSQNREGYNNRRDNNGGQSREGQGKNFPQNRNDRRNNNFNNKQKNKNKPFANDQREQRGYKDQRNNNRREFVQEAPLMILGEPYEVNGLLELAPKGFGFLRTQDNDFDQVNGGIYVSPEIIRKNVLRHCQWIHGRAHETNRGVQFCELISVNGQAPEEAKRLPHFEDLKAVNPNKRYCLETTPERYTTRVIDMMAPIGHGQRGLIVAPPRTGKTVLLQHMAEALVEKYADEVHLMILLIDERPEEVTEFKRGIQGAEVYASSNDGRVRDHCRLAELCIERAKRLVEAGKHVFLLMDSITRLARAYNNASTGNGRTMSGGIDARALEMPRRLFAAARNTRDAGSLTIIATALIETNSRMDDLIFQEFKGTGNMELVLNRRIAEQYIYPAVDILKSGTRREELILPELVLDKVNLIRRALAGHRPVEAMERLLFFLHKYPNNTQMLIDLKQRS